jgi:hypothetical protein
VEEVPSGKGELSMEMKRYQWTARIGNVPRGHGFEDDLSTAIAAADAEAEKLAADDLPGLWHVTVIDSTKPMMTMNPSWIGWAIAYERRGVSSGRPGYENDLENVRQHLKEKHAMTDEGMVGEGQMGYPPTGEVAQMERLHTSAHAQGWWSDPHLH